MMGRVVRVGRCPEFLRIKLIDGRFGFDFRALRWARGTTEREKPAMDEHASSRPRLDKYTTKRGNTQIGGTGWTVVGGDGPS